MDNLPGRVGLFFALWPAPDVARALHAWAQAAQVQSGGRVTRAEEFLLVRSVLSAAGPAYATVQLFALGGAA